MGVSFLYGYESVTIGALGQHFSEIFDPRARYTDNFRMPAESNLPSTERIVFAMLRPTSVLPASGTPVMKQIDLRVVHGRLDEGEGVESIVSRHNLARAVKCREG